MPSHRRTPRLHALPALLLLATSAISGHAAAADPQQTLRSALPSSTSETAITATNRIDPGWTRVEGCARDIAAGSTDTVLVTGCDMVPSSRGSSGLYQWTGARFVPYTAPGHGSAVATYGGNHYTIGGDAMLYASAAGSAWAQRPTPDGLPITDVAAGQGGLWIITSQPSGEGGNAIARARACADGSIAGGAPGSCGWQAMPGAGARIAVGQTAWVVNARDELFEWQDNAGGYWLQRPGCFTDVAANGVNVLAVACARNNVARVKEWAHGPWNDLGGDAMKIAVDAYGNPWHIDPKGGIWRARAPAQQGRAR